MILNTGEYTGEIKKMANENGVIASITGYSKKHFNDQLHCHENTNISFVIHGGCKLKKKSSIELVPGEIISNHSGEYHLVERVVDYPEHVNLEIEHSFFKEYNVDEGNLLAFLDKKPEAKFLMLKIYTELLAFDQLSMLSTNMFLLEFAMQIPKRKYLNLSQWPSWIKITEDYLYEHWNSKINLQDIAAAANAHPVTISKYFSNYFSCSISEFVRKIKTEKALTLIRNHNQSLSSIAYECGFADQSHFIRTFKKHTGLVPFAYKSL